MSIFQILAVFFALFMLYVMYVQRKKKILGLTEFSFWTSLWVFFIVISLFPDLLLGISTTLKLNRVFDLLVSGSFMVLTVLLFYTYFSLKRMTKRFEELVTDIALRSHQKRDSKQK